MDIHRLIGESEPAVVSGLSRFSPLAFSQLGIIKSIYRFDHYYDEPKYYKFKALINSTDKVSDGFDYPVNASGYSFFSEKEAILKCLGEAAERFCIKVYKEKNLIYGSFKQYGEEALNPKRVVSFSDKQKKRHKFEIFNFDDDSQFGWIYGHSLTSERTFLVPAQLAYLSYKRKLGEKMIRFPLTSGSAGGGSLAAAISRGIYEVVERDGFMIHYLNKLKSPKVDLYSIKNSKLRYILSYLKRYFLEVHTFDISTDLGIPSFLTVIIDKTGIGPAVSVGLKARLDYLKAIIGSIEESLNAREWIRGEVENNKSQINGTGPDNIFNLRERGIFWFPRGRIKDLDFMLNQKPHHPKYRRVSLSVGQQLKILVGIFKKRKYEVVYVNLSLPEVKKLGYKVVMVIIPELQPLFLKEKYPYLGGKRLYEVPKIMGFKEKITKENSLNHVPHPFL